MYDLKVAWMNVQCSLIWELLLYDFKLDHNTIEATKNICCVKDESAVNYSNQMVAQSHVTCHFHYLNKSICSFQIVSHDNKISKNLTHPIKMA